MTGAVKRKSKSLVMRAVAAPRFRTLLFGLFGGLAVCLAMASVYGVIAYAVSQRSSEIGVRMASGASAGSVLRLILSQGLALASLGHGSVVCHSMLK